MDRAKRDWRAWHEAYADPNSPLSRRLLIVQQLIREALDRFAPGPIRVLSACAGQGHDLLGVLPGHARAGDVSARLIEFDPVNTEAARRSAAAASPARVEVITGDASDLTLYEGAVPADLVLMCGIFGNVTDDDVLRTVDVLPALCAPGATVIWTRHRREPDLTVRIRQWLADRHFEEVAFRPPDDRELGLGQRSWFGVGAHVFRGTTSEFVRELKLFTFLR